MKKKKNIIVGYAAGAFDLFHIGHLNVLRRAKENCELLIVGVSTDELILKTKNKKPVIPFNERVQIVENIKFVDKVTAQDDLDKFKAWKKLKYDILFAGDDWKGSQRWMEYEQKLKNVGVRTIFFPYTKHTSSTKIANLIERLLE
jgi:glycerol-3-phosphate cytidylyltransferase